MISLLFCTLCLLSARLCAAQLQQCHRKDGSITSDLPCDPAANVSACCGQGYKCATSMFCVDKNGYDLLGTCTDPSWANPACPFRQLSQYMSQIGLKVTSSSNVILNADPGNNAFNYTLNTTDCHDGTICPNPKNDTCCFNNQGVTVITFHNSHL